MQSWLSSWMRASLTSAAMAGLLLVGASCQTTVTTADGTPPAPKPTEGPETPSAAKVNAFAITFAPKPADTNGNQLPDTLSVTAYLFSRPHPSPMFCDGKFHFAIYRSGQSGTPDQPGPDPLRQWSFSVAESQAARSTAMVGPCYEFSLSLLANRGSDVLPVEAVDLVAWFEPSDGSDAVWMRGIRSEPFPKPGN